MQITVFCSFTKMVNVEELVENPKNPNKHPESQIKALAKIIKGNGWRAPITVSNRSGFVVKGHGRLMAAKLLGCIDVPVDFQDYASEAAEYADLIADNKIAEFAKNDDEVLKQLLAEVHSSGMDIELTGFNASDLEHLLGAGFDAPEFLQDADEVPDAPVDPIAKPGDVWVLGNHRLMCGDSTVINDVEKLMGKEKADLIFTDPPYNVDYEGGNGLKIQNDSMNDESFFQFLMCAFSNMLLVSKPGSAIYVCHADSEGANFRLSMKKSGWLLKQCLIWVKSSLVMGRQDYHWQHEPILYGWAPGASHNWYADRKQTTVWHFDKPRKNGEHPTMKPVELIEQAAINSSKQNDVVLDLFGGSGTTLIACERTGRQARLMELDPKYCDVIIERWQNFTGKTAVLLNDKE